jgi:hypothetical protein
MWCYGVNFEMDVGLHRGGFTQMPSFSQLLKPLKIIAQLQVTGFDGVRSPYWQNAQRFKYATTRLGY